MMRSVRRVAVTGGALLGAYRMYTEYSRLSNGAHEVAGSTTTAGPGARVSLEYLKPQHFLSRRTGLLIHFKRWMASAILRPASLRRCQGNVFIVHGYGEHSGRYEHVARAFNAAGYNVFAIDHQGCGQSEGERSYCESLDHLVDDFVQFVHASLDWLRGEGEEQKGTDADGFGGTTVPNFLFGHSMGGLLAINIALASRDVWRGVVLSGPALMADPKEATPLLVALAKGLAGVVPKMTVKPLDIATLCRDQAVCAAYHNDPLVYHGAMHIRVGAEFFRLQEHTMRRAKDFTFPYLILHGGDDRLCLPLGSEQFHAVTGAQDKELRVLPGHFHELVNEPTREAVIKAIVSWIAARL